MKRSDQAKMQRGSGQARIRLGGNVEGPVGF